MKTMYAVAVVRCEYEVIKFPAFLSALEFEKVQGEV
jgi:hypothetical protein